MLAPLILLWSLYCMTLSLGEPAKKASVTKRQMLGIWRCLPSPPVSNLAERKVVLTMERYFCAVSLDCRILPVSGRGLWRRVLAYARALNVSGSGRLVERPQDTRRCKR